MPNNKKILIIEDEETMNEMFQNTLRNAGFETKGVFAIDEVLDAVKSFCPDFILLDNGLPEHKGEKGTQDGIKLIPDIKKILPNAKIIMFSNYYANDLADRAKKYANLKGFTFDESNCWNKMETLSDLCKKVKEELGI